MPAETSDDSPVLAPLSGVAVRTFADADYPVVRELYRTGLLGGSNTENDSGIDLDDIAMAYLRDGNHFWVATAPPESGSEPELIGMIGVQRHEEGVGEIRRLRVRPDRRRRGVGAKLLETAIGFCHERGYLKVNLDTYVDRGPAIKLFEKFHFRHGKTREAAGKQLIEFYLDLYGRDAGE